MSKIRVGKTRAKRSMKIISIGDRVFPGRYRLHTRFSRVVNFIRGEDLVSLVSEEVGRGPVNIVVRETDLGTAETLEISEGTVRIGGSSHPRAAVEVYDSRWEPGGIEGRIFAANRDRFERFLLENAPAESLVFLLDPAGGRGGESGFAGRMRGAIGEAAGNLFRSERDLVEGCGRLKGLGCGLTPGGDDFIAGLLTALVVLDRRDGADRSALRREMAAASRTGNLLSRSFISLAAQGRFFERLKNLLDALVGTNADTLRRRARELLSFGANSGSDLGTGLVLALKNFPPGEKNSDLVRI